LDIKTKSAICLKVFFAESMRKNKLQRTPCRDR